MLTKVRNKHPEKSDLETNHSFPIPENILKDINKKGFHLYNWIGEKDVKISIQRDFLKYIKKFGTPIALILIIPSIMILYWSTEVFFYLYFFGLLGIINFILLLYVLIISIKRSSILRKNAYVLITDSYISLNGKINKFGENKINSDKDLNNISELFEEELFKKSGVEKTKQGFGKKVIEQLTSGYGAILRMGRGGSRKSGQGILLLLVLYSIYAVSLGIVYFIGILFIWLFGILISIINKQILLVSGHKITSINNGFEDIDENSKKLIIEKNNLSKQLTDALNNDWKDSLLIKINSGIQNINKFANNAVDTSIDLKKEIKESKYSEMFNFGIYNSWIKKQIYTPLKQILDLLEKNLEILREQDNSIDVQIKNTEDVSLKGPLLANKKRVEMRIDEIQNHIPKIEDYLTKLQNN